MMFFIIQKLKRYSGKILSEAEIVTIGLFILYWSLFSDLCGNKVIFTLMSPDKKLKAILFERDCGATTDISSQVSLISATEDFKNKSGNIFVADCNHGKAPRTDGGGPEIKITWLSNDTLEIRYHKYARVFLKNLKYEGIIILYSTYD
jgi:hypothetical protein